MSVFALTLIRLALALLLAVRDNPEVTEAQRAQATAVATYAISYANQNPAALSGSAQSSTTQTDNLPPTTASTTPAAVPAGPPALIVSLNPTVQSVIPVVPALSQDVGSYYLTASSTEPITITTTTISVGAAGEATFQNIRLLFERVRWGDTKQYTSSSMSHVFSPFVPLTIPAGATVRMDITADILITGKGMTPATALVSCSGFGARTGTAVSCSPLPGQAITVGTASVAAFFNSSYSSLAVDPDKLNQKIGSYFMAPSLSEDVNLSTLTVALGANANRTLGGMKVMINGTQFGQKMWGGIMDYGSYTFSGTPVTLGAGTKTTTVEIYADVLSSAVGLDTATTISGCTATGVISKSYITCVNTVQGQPLTVTGS